MSSDEPAGATSSTRAPFAIKPVTCQPGLVLHNNVWKTTNQIVMEVNAADVRPLTDKFPVSAGLQHQASDKTNLGGRASGANDPGEMGGAGSSVSVFGEHKVSS